MDAEVNKVEIKKEETSKDKCSESLMHLCVKQSDPSHLVEGQANVTTQKRYQIIALCVCISNLTFHTFLINS